VDVESLLVTRTGHGKSQDRSDRGYEDADGDAHDVPLFLITVVIVSRTSADPLLPV
jgi:hypothetical protein